MTDTTMQRPTQAVGRRLRSLRDGFAHWRHTRPFWAGVWTIVGGGIIAYVPSTAMKFFFIANSSMVIGVLVGVIIAAFGLMLWFAEPLRIFLGVLTILLSLTSFMTSDFGGLLVGMLLGLVGGALAIAWEPHHIRHRDAHPHRQHRHFTVKFHLPHPHMPHWHGGARA